MYWILRVLVSCKKDNREEGQCSFYSWLLHALQSLGDVALQLLMSSGVFLEVAQSGRMLVVRPIVRRPLRSFSVEASQDDVVLSKYKSHSKINSPYEVHYIMQQRIF